MSRRYFRFLIFALTICGAVPGLPCAAADAPPGWSTDLEAAHELSAEEGKPLLILFGSDEDPPFAATNSVMRDRDVREELSHYVTVFVDGDADPHFARRIGASDVTGYVIFSHEGELIKLSSGAPTAPPVFEYYIRTTRLYYEQLRELNLAIAQAEDLRQAYEARGDLRTDRSLRDGGMRLLCEAALDYHAAMREAGEGDDLDRLEGKLRFIQDAILFKELDSVLAGNNFDHLNQLEQRFTSFVEEYPQHINAPDARVYAIRCMIGRGWEDEAKPLLEAIAQEYAGQRAGEAAQDELTHIEMNEYYRDHPDDF